MWSPIHWTSEASQYLYDPIHLHNSDNLHSWWFLITAFMINYFLLVKCFREFMLDTSDFNIFKYDPDYFWGFNKPSAHFHRHWFQKRVFSLGNSLCLGASIKTLYWPGYFHSRIPEMSKPGNESLLTYRMQQVPPVLDAGDILSVIHIESLQWKTTWQLTTWNHPYCKFYTTLNNSRLSSHLSDLHLKKLLPVLIWHPPSSCIVILEL